MQCNLICATNERLKTNFTSLIVFLLSSGAGHRIKRTRAVLTTRGRRSALASLEAALRQRRYHIMRESVSFGDMFGSDLRSAFDVVAEDKDNDAGSASGSESSTSEDVSSSGVPVAAGGGSAQCLHSAIGGARNSLGFAAAAAAAGQHHISSSVGSEDGAFHGNLHTIRHAV